MSFRNCDGFCEFPRMKIPFFSELWIWIPRGRNYLLQNNWFLPRNSWIELDWKFNSLLSFCSLFSCCLCSAKCLALVMVIGLVVWIRACLSFFIVLSILFAKHLAEYQILLVVARMNFYLCVYVGECIKYFSIK